MALEPQVRWINDAAAQEAAPQSDDEARQGASRFGCAFCGKDQHEVNKLIAGPDVFICDACVARCDRIIAEDRFLGRNVKRIRHGVAAFGQWLRADKHRTALWATLSLIVILQLALLYGVYVTP